MPKPRNEYNRSTVAKRVVERLAASFCCRRYLRDARGSARAADKAADSAPAAAAPFAWDDFMWRPYGLRRRVSTGRVRISRLEQPREAD